MEASKTAGKKTAKIRILIVDDHPLLREGLGTRIKGESDMVVCGEAGTVTEAMKVMEQLKPDVAIVDITLPGRDGIELIKDMRSQFPEARILAFSFHDESLYAERALRAGAAGYLMKSTPPDRLINAIRKVMQGEFVLGEGLVNRILQGVGKTGTDSVKDRLALLSDRELEVFRLIGAGHQRRQIAHELNISIKTVDCHRGNICTKLNLNGFSELLHYAVQHANAQSPIAASITRSS